MFKKSYKIKIVVFWGGVVGAVEKLDKLVDVVNVVKGIKIVLDSVVSEVDVDGRALVEPLEASFLP